MEPAISESKTDRLTRSYSADQVYVETQVTALSTGTDLGNYLGQFYGYSWRSRLSAMLLAIRMSVSSARSGPMPRICSPWPACFFFETSPVCLYRPSIRIDGPVYPMVFPRSRLPSRISRNWGWPPYATRDMKAGSRWLWSGLGVIGLGTVAIARAMGATVTAVANSSLRGDSAMQVGAHYVHVVGNGAAPTEWMWLCSPPIHGPPSVYL